tara:strand:+ start:134 stop:310 length:177 start_codon:yes stop_codon:yes gene_type:complete
MMVHIRGWFFLYKIKGLEGLRAIIVRFFKLFFFGALFGAKSNKGKSVASRIKQQKTLL